MSDTAWLKQVLADAKAAQQTRPAWAKTTEVQTSLNAHPVQEHQADEVCNEAQAIAARRAQNNLDIK